MSTEIVGEAAGEASAGLRAGLELAVAFRDGVPVFRPAP